MHIEHSLLYSTTSMYPYFCWMQHSSDNLPLLPGFSSVSDSVKHYVVSLGKKNIAPSKMHKNLTEFPLTPPHSLLFKIILFKKMFLLLFCVLPAFTAFSIRISSEHSSLANSLQFCHQRFERQHERSEIHMAGSHRPVHGFRISLYKWELQWPE